MTGIVTPHLFTGGSHWFKHQLLQLDEAGNLASIQLFQGETERTLACSGILFPAFPASVATTPEAALAWFTDAFKQEEGITVLALLERLFPCTVLEIGQPVVLWNLENVYPDACCLPSDSVINQLYP